MKFVDKVFKFEDEVKNWMNSHRVKMIFIAIFLGVGLGIGGGYFLHAHTRQIALMSLSYSTILVSVELFAGGENQEW